MGADFLTFISRIVSNYSQIPHILLSPFQHRSITMKMISAIFSLRLQMNVVIAMLALLALCSVVPAMALGAETAEPPAATVNGRAITNAEVDAYSDALHLPREYALRDLIDLMLLKAAATELRVKLPDEPWSSDAQDGVELAVAQGIGIEAAKLRIELVVDHAWLKDAEDASERATGREVLEKLRAQAVKGVSIPDAFARMQLDGSLWHIGDHEEYPYEVIPAEARDMPPGAISPVIPGDGGLHLFRIYEKKQSLVPMEVISSQLRDELRRRATIEQPAGE